MKGPGLRVAWGASVLVVTAAYVAAVVPERARVADARAQARVVYDAANREERVLAAEPLVRHILHQVRAEATGFSSLQFSTSAALRLLDRESRRSRVRITSVTPVATTSPPEGHEAISLQTRRLTIELEGEYPNIVRFISDLSTAEVLLGLDSVSVAVRGTQAQGIPLLRAELGASLYRVASQPKGQAEDADTASR